MHLRCAVVFLLSACALVGRSLAQPSPKSWTVKAGPDWIPFTPSRDVEARSALDFSGQGALDAPAGKYGWVRAVGPHFEFEQRPGVNQRFYGANLCMEANYPRTEAEADLLVTRLVRTGYNAVRIHHHDGKLYRLGKDRRPVLNEPAIAQLDRFLAKAFAAGIYVTTDLYVSRKVSWREIGVDRDGSDGLDFKTLLFVHDGALQNWKDAAKAFFSHRNPLTGRTYAEEPALAFICLVNENSIQQVIKRRAQNPDLKAAWKMWLTSERKKTPNCWPSLTPEEIPANGGGWSPAPVLEGEAWDAVSRFCAGLEKRMYTRMRDYLRNELGVKALLTDENWGTQPAPMQAVRARLFDYVDAHHYVDHPEFPVGGWRLPSTLKNENILGKDGCSVEVSWRRVANKPFAVSEWNFSGPARHRSMSGLYMGTLAALQDWNSLWRFAFSHWFDAYDYNFGSLGYFDVVNDPVALLSERLFVPLFLRGDLKPLETTVATELTPDSVMPPTCDRAYNVLPRWANRQWDFRVATVLPGKALANMVTVPMDKAAVDENPPVVPRSSTCVTHDRTRCTLSVATDRTCALYATRGKFVAGALWVKNEGGEATVWVTSLDGRPIQSSGRLLVVRLGDVQSIGTEFADDSCRKVLKWGKGSCMEAGRSEIFIRRKRPCTVWLLDMAGRRRRQVPASFAGGILRLIADVSEDLEEASFAYELCDEG